MKIQAKQKYQKMRFRAYDGMEMEEYIPGEVNKYKSWVLVKYGILRSKLGLNVYYWHIRHNHSPHDRKRLDLDFVQHGVLDHDSNPDDPIEKRHFQKAWKLYGFEVNYALEEFKKLKKAEVQKFTPELEAYLERWHTYYKEPDRKLMYHGMKLVDYMTLLMLFDEREKQRRLEYCKENGLEPIT